MRLYLSKQYDQIQPWTRCILNAEYIYNHMHIHTLSNYTYVLPILLNTWQVSIKDPYFSWISSWKNKNDLTNLVNLLETGRPTNRHRWEVIVLFPRSQSRWLPERPKKVRSKLPKKVAKCGRFWQGSRVSTGKHPPNQCISCSML